MDHETLVRLVSTATQEVFSTMLGVQATPGAAQIETSACATTEPVVALIGFAGAWVGTGMIGCSPVLACKIASLMLMTEFQSVDSDVLDAVAEVSNMIFGNVKTMLEENLGPMGLSIPTVIFGKNFTTRSIGQQSWTVIHFETEVGDISTRICLAPSDASARLASKRAGSPIYTCSGPWAAQS
jgi:chemotaxis protein CheX